MARGNLKTCLPIVLHHEGGWADHPKDPGGATMKGVTIGTFADFKGRRVTKDELKNISDADLSAIYKRGYWDAVEGESLQHGVDLAVFDLAVNSGPGRAARTLQKVVKVKQDGKIGVVTLTVQTKLRGDDLVKLICSSRMSFLRGLRHWSTFGKGWSRRVADIEARGVAMWLKVNGTVGGATMAMVDESQRATASAKAKDKAATGTTVGSVGGTVAGEASGLDPALMLAAAGVGLLIVLWLMFRGRHDRSRAEAYSRVAYEVRAAR